MTTVILVIHLLITVFLIGFIMLQRSEGGALGMGGGGMGGLMNARGSANFLTRTTKYLGIAFFATSIILALLSSSHTNGGSFADQIQNSTTQEAPATAPKENNSEPSAPLPK
ncbi:MAG: preprotein translocase subunit SecG [Alphaproteobacteria bacterium]|nr:MAG: preprotein translocase subunit SecG [Alphaproteobacteria bacterium]